jgi:hypothetical protein
VNGRFSTAYGFPSHQRQKRNKDRKKGDGGNFHLFLPLSISTPVGNHTAYDDAIGNLRSIFLSPLSFCFLRERKGEKKKKRRRKRSNARKHPSLFFDRFSITPDANSRTLLALSLSIHLLLSFS